MDHLLNRLHWITPTGANRVLSAPSFLTEQSMPEAGRERRTAGAGMAGEAARERKWRAGAGGGQRLGKRLGRARVGGREGKAPHRTRRSFSPNGVSWGGRVTPLDNGCARDNAAGLRRARGKASGRGGGGGGGWDGRESGGQVRSGG